MITSAGNSKIKRVIQLNQKAKARRDENVFLVEGLKMFLEAPDKKIRDVYVTESFYHKNPNCQKKIMDCNFEFVSEGVFEKIADTKTPQGILCIVEQFEYQLNQMIANRNPFLVVIEDLQDPGNLGTIVRTGEGAGIDGIIMSRNTVDIYNPKTIRATMGSIYRVPFLYVDRLEDVLLKMHARGIQTYAAHLKGNQYYNSYSFVEGTAFLIGNEGNGLRDETADQATSYIKIPMSGQVESLNAAIATSLLMYEARRQRSHLEN